MAATFKEGDRVQVVDREATADDVKSGLFYNYFSGLTGNIQKVYTTGEAAIEVETESLDEPVAARHADVQEQMKSKWLDGLSEEARNRLTDAEKDFRLRYTILVNQTDLMQPDGKPKPKRIVETPAPAPSPVKAVAQAEETHRATSEELAAAEEEYLKSRSAMQ